MTLNKPLTNWIYLLYGEHAEQVIDRSAFLGIQYGRRIFEAKDNRSLVREIIALHVDVATMLRSVGLNPLRRIALETNLLFSAPLRILHGLV